MPQLFKGQSLLQIKLDTGIDVSTATVKKILWQDPNGDRGFWTVSSVEALTILVYNVTSSDVTVEGRWRLQAYVEIGGLEGYGEIVEQTFYDNLNIPL